MKEIIFNLLDLHVSKLNIIFVLITCLLFHIIEDFHLQGILANLKQKNWWKKTYLAEMSDPNNIYRCDYIVGLIVHSLEWAMFIHIPIIPTIYTTSLYNRPLAVIELIITLTINTVIHAVVDSMKCNRLKLNLVEDQIMHLLQILATILLYSIIW